MKVLIVDNYDSFTYNLVHLVEKIRGEQIFIKRNNQLELKEVEEFDKIILSPGPGLPSQAGIMPTIIETFHGKKDFLGVCLGMQAIGEFSGAKLKNLSKVGHGITSKISHFGNHNLFRNIPETFKGGRYHSWVIDPISIPEDLEIIANDAEGNIMAIQHKKFKLLGLQFHPESILTEFGEVMIKNWLESS